MARFYQGHIPKDITPMACVTPLLMVKRDVSNVPLDSAGTVNPCVTTVSKMTSILINASVLAFASYSN
jgi:hypothetical protein